MEDGAVDLGIPGLTDAVEVARGGFSTVFRARQRAMERTVAVKLIHATVVDPVAGEHFLREVRATGRLSQHPNVAPVYDVGTTAAGQPYLIMPYYERGSLEQRLTSRGALSEGESVRLARTLATTLEYVHQHGILHRDIKPANVLLTEFDEPLLADFGVARLVDASVPVHTTGANVVTWAYGPPEAFTGGEPTRGLGHLLPRRHRLRHAHRAAAVRRRRGRQRLHGAQPHRQRRGARPARPRDLRPCRRRGPPDHGQGPGRPSGLRGRVRDHAHPPAPTPSPRTARRTRRRTGRAGARRGRSSPTNRSRPVLAAVVEPAEPVTADEPVEPDEPATPEPSFSRDSVGDPATDPARTSSSLPRWSRLRSNPTGPRTRTRTRTPLRPPGARSRPRARPRGAEQAAPTGSGRGPIVLGVLVAAAALLSFLAIRRNLYEGYGSVLDDSFLADVGAWAPTVALVVGLVLLWRRTGVGAEWIIGAGAAFVLLNYGGLVDFLRREDTSLDTTAMVMRTIAAALTVVAVVIAWRLAEVPGPRINLVMGVVLVVAAIVALTGTRDYGDHVDLKVRSWLIIALIVLLLVRGLAFAPRTTGAPALVAGGLVGALAGLESGAREQWDSGVRSSLILATVGFAVMAVVGVLRWRQSRPPSTPVGGTVRRDPAAVTAAAPA